jgi:hypothetical protein
MDKLLLIVTLTLIGLTFIRLFPIIKDGKITAAEKAKVQEILIDTVKDFLLINNSNSKDDIKVAVANITMKKLDQENIKGFAREDIDQMSSIVVDKLDEVIKK